MCKCAGECVKSADIDASGVGADAGLAGLLPVLCGLRDRVAEALARLSLFCSRLSPQVAMAMLAAAVSVQTVNG